MGRIRSVRYGVLAALLGSVFFVQARTSANGRGLQVPNNTVPAQASGAGTPGGNHPAENHPIMVELFTSEGCSSCPPADAFLLKLDDTQPVPDAQIIVLSEHVDYWDHDGWKDANSSAALTERQVAYVNALGLKTPYTPQIIVDGTVVMPLTDAQQVKQVFDRAVSAPKIPVRIGEVTVDAGNPPVLRTQIDADGSSEKRNADVYVAVALDHVESQVLHGENGGRHLIHVAVVQQLTKIGKVKKGQNFSEPVQLKLKPGIDPKNVRVVAFVQESGPGKMLGAALRKPAS